MNIPASAPASGPPAGVTFDAPLQAATTVNVPAPAPAASAPASGAVPAGVTFDAPLQAATTVSVSGTPSAQPAPQAAPQATISATPGSMPGDPMAAKVQNWASNVSSDLMHGTSITGVGKFLKSLGAHGFDVGVSPQVAAFMGSLPLGLLQAAKGSAETAQSGQRLQGAKDIGGGLLDAATIPGSFVAPEAGEVAAEEMTKAGTEIAEQAGNAKKFVRGKFSLDDIENALQGTTADIEKDAQEKLANAQTAFHGDIRNLVTSAAKDAGVNVKPSESMHDVAGDAAAALKQKASGLYKQIDAAIGGTRFQSFDEQLKNVKQALRNSAGIDHDADGKLIERINAIQDAKDAAWEQAKAAGVNPKLGDEADALWRRASALEDLGKRIQTATSGLRPDLANGVNAASEATSPTNLAKNANKLYNTGRLQQALGDDGADNLLKSIESAKQSMKDIATEAAEKVKAAEGSAANSRDAVKGNRAAMKRGVTTAAGVAGAGSLVGWIHHLLAE